MANLESSFHTGHDVNWLNYFSVLLMDIEVKRRLAETIRKARGERSQRQFAKDLGVSQAAVQSWENLESFPGTDSMKAIATSMGMSLDELLLHIQGEMIAHPPAPKVAEDALHLVDQLSREETARLIKILVDKLLKQ